MIKIKKPKLILILLSMFLLVVISGCSKEDVYLGEDQAIKKYLPKVIQGENSKPYEKDVEEEILETEGLMDDQVVIGEDSKAGYFKVYEEFEYMEANTLASVYLEAFNSMGDPVWIHRWGDLVPTELSLSSEPLVADGKIYIGVYGSLYCLDGKRGQVDWTNSHNIGGGTYIYLFKDRLYITSYYGDILTCLDKDSGEKIFSISNVDLYWGYEVFGVGDQIIVRYGDHDDGLYIACNYLNGQIEEYGQGDLARNDLVTWDKAEASSILENNIKNYGPMNIIDKDTDTAWVEGVDGYGIGQWIRIEREKHIDISKIRIRNGYQKSYETLENNARLKSFRLDLSQDQYIYYNFDESDLSFKPTTIYLDRPINTNSIKLTIVDVFEGKKYQDTCISELNAY